MTTQTATRKYSTASGTELLIYDTREAIGASLFSGLCGPDETTPDVEIGFESGRVGFMERQSDSSGPEFRLWPAATAPTDATLVPLGHQHPDCPAMVPPLPQQRPPRMAAVAIIVDPQDRVLLSRRPAHMRTFPGAWVLPGGGQDPDDASLMAAALREVEEEVGILPAYLTAVRPLCLWESCYPTTAEAWAQTEKRSHHLLVYYVARLLTSEETAPVVLQAEECDNACWVPLRDLAGPLGRSEATHVAAYPRAPGAPTGAAVPAASLAGVYPNAMGEGVARGHCFAFRVLANSHGGMGLGQPAVEF